jgi:hypothetical protein
MQEHAAFQAEGGARLADGDPLRANRGNAREGALISVIHWTIRL